MSVVQQISVFSRKDGRTDLRVPMLIMQSARTSHVWRHTALFLSLLILDDLNVLADTVEPVILPTLPSYNTERQILLVC